MAIVTKSLMARVKLFHDRVNVVSNSLPKKSRHVIALNTLVECNTELLSMLLETPNADFKLTDYPQLVAIRNKHSDDAEVVAIAKQLQEAWDVIIGSLPQWQQVVDELVQPGQLRKDKLVFAFGVGWQGLATAAAALIKHRPGSWKEDLKKAIKAVNWQPGPHWNGIAMAGDRINNTRPGINATAGYILEAGGFKKGQGVEIDKYLDLLAKARGGSKVAVAA